MTKREFLAMGEMIFEGLKSGALAIQYATDQLLSFSGSCRTTTTHSPPEWRRDVAQAEPK